MMQRWAAIAVAAFRREPWWAEWWAACAALGCSLWALTAPHGSVAERAALRVVVDMAGVPFWEVSGIALFIAQAAALIVNVRLARWALCLIAAWWWAALGLGILAADPNAFLLPCVGVMVGINLFSVFRLLRIYPPHHGAA